MARFQKNQKFDHLNSKHQKWRNYQTELKQSALKKRTISNTIKYAFIVGFFVIAIYFGWVGINAVFDTIAAKGRFESDGDKKETIAEINVLDKNEVQTLLGNRNFVNLEDPDFTFVRDGKTFQVQTSLNMGMHNFLSSRLDRKNSKWISIVIMEPSSGRILTMIGYDRADPSNNPSTDSRFPAASVFKIITASAAIEKCGYVADTILTFNGGKYTLYKSQLKKKKNRYTNRISFRDSFAQSINPVFGKIGVHCLNKSDLENYAEGFGFNQKISFEIPLSPSFISISDKPYNWAEIASGFNRKTRLSPIHGAMLAATVLNDGWLIEPTIIDKITDEEGKNVYQSKRIPIKQAITLVTSKILRDLLTATVKTGTSKKYFRPYRRDKVLSKLTIGGKTGSIYNTTRDAKIDWFVGFADQKGASKQIAISILVAHSKYIGKRATVYARAAIREYFKDILTSKVASNKAEGK